MFGPGRELVARARSQVREDVRADPYLLYILVGATLLAGVWFWHRIPNTATRDEWKRLRDVVIPYGLVLDDPSFDSLQRGVEHGRALGATKYLFGLALLPVVAYAVLSGQAEIFTSIGYPNRQLGYYRMWAGTPSWVWTWSLGLVRLFNLAFAVGSVYLTYRLGTAIEDRATGRVAAVVLTLTFGFLTIAHEGGEDMPALFLVLLALNLVSIYVRTGDVAAYFAGAVSGGAAIAFKLSAGPIVFVIGAAHLFRALKSDENTVTALLKPKAVLGGALLGAVTIGVGFPTLLFVGVDPFVARVFGTSAGRSSGVFGPTAPVTWWFLRGYVSAFGLPLFVAALAGVVASVVRLRHRRPGIYGTGLVMALFGIYLAIFSRWHDFRVHHLLPTFPAIAILLAQSVADFRAWKPRVARPLLAVLLVTTAVYAGTGAATYATMPRDQAEAWLHENADENDTVEVYRVHIQDTAVPHWMDVNHRYMDESARDPCPDYIQLGYRDLLYLREGTYYRNGETQAEYIRGLLTGEDGYEIAAEFGTRPGGQRFGPTPEGELATFTPNRATPGDYGDLLRYGVVPHTDQFADEQELAYNQYTVILERSEPCTTRHTAPF